MMRKAIVIIAALFVFVFALSAQTATTPTQCGAYQLWPPQYVAAGQTPAVPYNGCYDQYEYAFFAVGYPKGISTLLQFSNPTLKELTPAYMTFDQFGQNFAILQWDGNNGPTVISSGTTSELPTVPGQTRVLYAFAKTQAGSLVNQPIPGTFVGSVRVLLSTDGFDTSPLDQVAAQMATATAENSVLQLQLVDGSGQQIFMYKATQASSIAPGAEQVVPVSVLPAALETSFPFGSELLALGNSTGRGPFLVVKNLDDPMVVVNLKAASLKLYDNDGNQVCATTTRDIALGPGNTEAGYIVGDLFPRSCFVVAPSPSRRPGSRAVSAAWTGFIHVTPLSTDGRFLPVVFDPLSGVGQ